MLCFQVYRIEAQLSGTSHSMKRMYAWVLLACMDRDAGLATLLDIGSSPAAILTLNKVPQHGDKQ